MSASYSSNYGHAAKTSVLLLLSLCMGLTDNRTAVWAAFTFTPSRVDCWTSRLIDPRSRHCMPVFSSLP